MRSRGNAAGPNRWSVGLALAVLTSACFVPPALPIRGVLAGAPGRLADGELELSGGPIGFMNGVQGIEPPLAGGGWVAHALTQNVSVELGGFTVPVGPGAGFGFAGARWTRAVLTTASGTLFADADVGLGAGGTLCTSSTCPGSRSPRVFELGSTQGGALGFTTGPFSVYARVKLEEGSTARGPLMLFPFGVLGVELRLARVVSIGVAAGGMSFVDPRQSLGGFAPFYQLQATLFLDAPWRRATATSATAR
jgi:hypothetical protein